MGLFSKDAPQQPQRVLMPFNRRTLSEQAAEIYDNMLKIEQDAVAYRIRAEELQEELIKIRDELISVRLERNEVLLQATVAKDENSRLKERLAIGLEVFMKALHPTEPPAPKDEKAAEKMVDELNHIVMNVERSDIPKGFDETPPTPEPPIGDAPWAAYAPKPKEEEEMVEVGPPPQELDNRRKREWWMDRVGHLPASYKNTTITWPASKLRKPTDEALADVEAYMKNRPKVLYNDVTDPPDGS